MKAILVMEMPESCHKCPLFSGHYSDMTCRGNHKTIDYPYPDNKVQEWCPLKAMPQRANHPDYCDNGRFDMGWNACLNSIAGNNDNETVQAPADNKTYCPDQGWTPAEDPPASGEYILLSFENFSVPLVGRYEEDEEGGGIFYLGDEDESCINHDLIVNAWMPLPESYKE